METTSRLGLKKPVTSDALTGLRTAIRDNADALDTAALFLTGAAADRPAPSTPGRIHYATDTGRHSYDTGAAWVPIGDRLPAAVTGTDGKALIADAAAPDGFRFGQVPAAGLADGAVTLAKIAAAVPAIVAASGSRRTFQPFAVTKPGVAGSGWQTLTVPYGFTMSAVDIALAIPAPQTNGSSLAGWSLSAIGTSSMTFFVNNATLQDIVFYGFVIGTP